MATVTGKTSLKIDELIQLLQAKLIVSAQVDSNGVLTMTNSSGETFNLGNVRGTPGPTGISVVKHHNNPDVIRPVGATVVHWIGEIRPVNAIDTDWWTRSNL